MSTAIPREALRTLMATLSGLPAARVYWLNEPEKSIGPFNSGKAGKITLNAFARAAVGCEETSRTFNVSTGLQTVELAGQRKVSISIKAENFLGLGEAEDLLELIRLRLARASSTAALRAAGLSYQEATDVQKIPGSQDNRAISVATMDLICGQVVSETDTSADPNGWVEKVHSDTPVDPVAASIVDLKTGFHEP